MGLCHSKVYPENDVCHQCNCKIITIHNMIVCSYCNIKLHPSCTNQMTRCMNCFAIGTLNCLSTEINPEYVLLQ